MTTHACPGGCGRAGIPSYQLACRGCWYRLPRDLRERINHAWRHSASAHLAARAEAVSYWKGET